MADFGSMTNPTLSQGGGTDWSLEATLPRAGEIRGAKMFLASGHQVFVNALPRVTHEEQLGAVRQIARAGFTPVPHLSARSFTGLDELGAYLATAREIGVKSVLLIGGDISAPRGPFSQATDVLDSGVLANNGIKSVGFGAYPAGHPWLAREPAFALLRTKIERAAAAGHAPFVITQFGFESRPIHTWLKEASAHGIDVPIHVGIAGPAGIGKLTNIALRCLIDLPAERLGLALDLMRGGHAARLIDEVRAAVATPVSFHIFGFGGLDRTAAWVDKMRAASSPRSGQPGSYHASV
jgi:methylenetetrahydrofolate reductase (NADPH)